MSKQDEKINRFVSEYLIDRNGKRAATVAGYSPKSAEVAASRLLRNVKVRALIDKRDKERQERVEVKADEVLRELLRMARTDIRQAFNEDGSLKPVQDLPEDLARAIASIEVDEIYDGRGSGKRVVGYTRKLKFWPKDRSLEMLGRHLALFTDKIDATITQPEPIQFVPAKATKKNASGRGN